MSERSAAEFWFDPICPWAWTEGIDEITRSSTQGPNVTTRS